MRILYVLPFVPWPIKVRSYNLIPRLAERHEVHLTCVLRSATDAAHLEAVRPYCASVRTGSFGLAGALARCAIALPSRKPLRIAYSASGSMCRAVEAAIRQARPDVIYVERWRALQYVPSDCGIPVVCDPTDSMALYNSRLMRAGRPWERVIAAEEYTKFRSYEARLVRQVATTVFCSRLDLEYIARVAPRANLAKVVNGVDCKQFYLKIPEEERPDTLFFSGNFRYGPNRHAVNHFLENIFPLIRRSKPNVRLSIVGNDAAPFMRRSHPAATGVEVHDYVVHLRPHLAAATVAVAPITVGSGVSNKVMEAFAVGTSIVSTSMACGDLPVRDGDHLYIADAPEVFASRVVALLSDRGLREQMARRAHELAAREYDWEVVAGSMERVLFDAAGEPPAGRSRTGVTARAALSQTAEV